MTRTQDSAEEFLASAEVDCEVLTFEGEDRVAAL